MLASLMFTIWSSVTNAEGPNNGAGTGTGIWHEVGFGGKIFDNFVQFNDGPAIRADNSRDVDISYNHVVVGEIGDGIQIHEKSPATGVAISGNPFSVHYLQWCTWNNTVHNNTVVFKETRDGLTGAYFEKDLEKEDSTLQDFENCVVDPRNGDIDQLNVSIPLFDARRVFFSNNTYIDNISSNEKRWQWGMGDITDDHLLTFSEFQMRHQEPGGTLFPGSPPAVSGQCQEPPSFSR
jgi:hypothetical protein